MPGTRLHRAIVWALAVSLVSVAARASEGPSPLVIAHRGASGYLPEHTLPAYALAFGQGADFIEPDLVLTKDGRFICLHDIHLEATTDVAEVFPSRHRDDGRFYAADFTLDEIRRLAARERLEDRFPRAGSRFSIPTFEEMIELVQGLNRTTGRRVGIYPELKAPAFHRAEDLPMEAAFLGVVRSYGIDRAEMPIFVQSFEAEPLVRMRELGSKLPQIMLLGGGEVYRSMATEEGLRKIAEFANGIGPAKSYLVAQPDLVERAHAAGLLVHPYTFRADQLPDGVATLEVELETYFVELGVDGLFTDHPDRARAFLDDLSE